MCLWPLLTAFARNFTAVHGSTLDTRGNRTTSRARGKPAADWPRRRLEISIVARFRSSIEFESTAAERVTSDCAGLVCRKYSRIFRGCDSPKSEYYARNRECSVEHECSLYYCVRSLPERRYRWMISRDDLPPLLSAGRQELEFQDVWPNSTGIILCPR